jgi:hypothetical protein
MLVYNENMCGCNQNISSYEQVPNTRKQVDTMSGKWILDVQNRELYLENPIYDVYGDIIGYITKNKSGDIVRIFSKNIVQIIG